MKVDGAQSAGSQNLPPRDNGLAAASNVAQTPVGDLPTADQQKANKLAIVNGTPIVAVTPKPKPVAQKKRDAAEADEDAMDADLANKEAKH